MRGSSASRKRQTGPLTAVGVTVASIAIHGLVLLGLQAQGGLLGSASALAPSRGGDADRPSAEPAVNALPSCEADEALASAAQVFWCATPMADRDLCLRRALDEFAAGRIRCHTVELPASIALVEPRLLDEIEPEPLIELLDPEVIEELKKPEPPKVAEAPAPAAPPPPPPPPPPPRNQQVVEITQPETEDAPDNARFLSEYNSRAERETVARGSTEEMVERPDPRQLKPVDNPREAAVNEVPEQPVDSPDNPDAPEGAGQLSMRAPGAPEIARLPQEARDPGAMDGSLSPMSSLGIQAPKGSGPTRDDPQEAVDPQRGQGGGGGGRPLVPNLRPTSEVLERALGGGSVDKLDNVADGEVTALNSKQWKFASFFNRLKRRVAQNWRPNAVLARRDPTGKVYGTADRVTYVQVSLDTSGAVTAIHIVKSSGVEDLDDEAIRAIRAAQPFPNPPLALIDQQSRKITFPFGFHLARGRSGWNIFRYR